MCQIQQEAGVLYIYIGGEWEFENHSQVQDLAWTARFRGATHEGHCESVELLAHVILPTPD